METGDAKALFERTYGAARLNLGGVGEKVALERPGEAGNPINWIVGHALAYRGRLLRLLGAEPPEIAAALAPYDGDAAVEWSPERALSLRRLREGLRASQERLTAALDGLAPGPVDEAVGASGQSGVPFFHFHEAYHVGQIGLARRCLGLPGVIEPSDASRV